MKKAHVLTIYKGKGGHRWRLQSGNYRKVANGGEAFSSLTKARESFKKIAGTRPMWLVEKTKTLERWLVSL